MFTRQAIAAFALLLVTAIPSMADSAIFQQLLDASVYIENPEESVAGSGVVIDAERRLVLTNYHVVGEASRVAVFFAAFDGEGQLVTDTQTYIENFTNLRENKIACIGEVIGTWEERDLALIELESIPGDVTAVPLAATSPSPGEAVHSVGNPAASGALWVYSHGNVRQVYNRVLRYENGQTVDARMLEVTSPINSGDSGGGMVNAAGELIGIVNASRDQGTLMSYAIDVNEVKTFMESFGSDTDTDIASQPEVLVAGTSVAATQLHWPQ